MAYFCGKHGLSSPASCEWKASYGGLDVSEAWPLKAAEDLLGKVVTPAVLLGGFGLSAVDLRDERAAGVPGYRAGSDKRALLVDTAR